MREKVLALVLTYSSLSIQKIICLTISFSSFQIMNGFNRNSNSLKTDYNQKELQKEMEKL